MATRLTLLPKKERPNHATPPAVCLCHRCEPCRVGRRHLLQNARHVIALFSLGGLVGAASSWLAPLPNPSPLKRMMAVAAFVCVYSVIVLLAS